MQAPGHERNAALCGWTTALANTSKWIELAAKNSLIIGFFATLVATALGTLAALGLSRPEILPGRAGRSWRC